MFCSSVSPWNTSLHLLEPLFNAWVYVDLWKLILWVKHDSKDNNPTNVCAQVHKNVRQPGHKRPLNGRCYVDLDSLIVCWTHCNVTWMYPEHFNQTLDLSPFRHEYYAPKSLMWTWFEDLDWKDCFWEKIALKGKYLIVTVELSFIWRQHLLYALF